jgi:hypothetical protein
LEAFKIFKARFENVTNHKIRMIRTDGGSQYKNVFQDFLTSEGIVLARSCHSDSKLPLKYYSDAQRYVVYTLNRIIRDTDNKSPYEHIYGKPPNLFNLHAFGSICFLYQPKAKRLKGKLTDSGER